MIPKGKYGKGNRLIHVRLTSAQNIKERALYESAKELGYRSYSHLRTKGKKDLLLCQSLALDMFAKKQREELEKKYYGETN